MKDQEDKILAAFTHGVDGPPSDFKVFIVEVHGTEEQIDEMLNWGLDNNVHIMSVQEKVNEEE